MIDDIMRDAYDEYLDKHINAVRTAFDWICVNLPELVKDYDADVLGELISAHDCSKWDDEEYFAYCEYFYGEKTPEVELEFDYAWLHHQHNNPHHWQHWLLREDDGGMKALAMPYKYILEMICDWWAFSWNKNDLFEIFNWYDNNTEKHLFHNDTKKTVEDILSKLKDKLTDMNI